MSDEGFASSSGLGVGGAVRRFGQERPGPWTMAVVGAWCAWATGLLCLRRPDPRNKKNWYVEKEGGAVRDS